MLTHMSSAVACESCGNFVDPQSMSYLPDGRMVCRQCGSKASLTASAPNKASTGKVLGIVIVLLLACFVTFAMVGVLRDATARDEKKAEAKAKKDAFRQERDRLMREVPVTMYFTKW